jgi:hypothetical protein
MLRVRNSVFLVILVVLAFALPASAGGAATVNLDELPTEVHAGEPLHLTFTIWQHGQRLVDGFEGVGPVVPYLEATNPETGETLRVDAYKPEGGEVGHFAVDVTFPSAGSWEWQIYPEPFALMNEFELLTVQPELAAAHVVAGAATSNEDSLRTLLRWGAVGTLFAAVIAMAFARRQTVRRPVAVGQR